MARVLAPVVALLLVALPATADLNPLLPPTGLEAHRDDGQAIVTWDDVSGAVAYLVYRDGVLLGTVTDPLFMEPAPMTAAYMVRAVDASGVQSLPSAPALLDPMSCIVTDFSEPPFVFVNWEDCDLPST